MLGGESAVGVKCLIVGVGDIINMSDVCAMMGWM